MPIRVLIVDDHEVVRQGLQLMLEATDDLRVVGHASTGEQALERVAALRPDLLLLDLRLPGRDGIKVLRQIKRSQPNTKVLVLTGIDTRHEVLEAIAAGADGYALKQISARQLVDAIRAVAAGQSYLHPAVTSGVVTAARDRLRPDTTGWGLSRRELDVLALMARGYGNADIARQLFISQETVRSHVKSVMRKMGKKHRVEAVLAAVAAGLVELQPADVGPP